MKSQSLVIEMQACRSAFLSWLSPILHKTFGGSQAAFAPHADEAAFDPPPHACEVGRDADEMTYPAHVALRFDLERALLTGDLAVADLPAAWNDGMRCRLGITPPSASLGCLQDIHWYAGLIGYFPNYTLGAIAAAQLMAAVRRDAPGLDDALAQGDFTPLMAWLRTRVHGQGALYGLHGLLVHATGKPLDIADFEAHLHARYLGMG
jgi:carboxypeptidase Taq